MRNVSDRSCLENRSTHFVFNSFFFSDHLTSYEIMWKDIVERSRPQMTIRRMRIACWVPKVTNTPLKYVMPFAFPPQQWLHQRTSVLPYTYTACLVLFKIFILPSHLPSFGLCHLVRSHHFPPSFPATPLFGRK